MLHGLLQSQKNTGGRNYYLTDAHPGSVAALTNSAGNVTVRYRYGPFGEPKQQLGSLANSLRFASQEYMPALGISKMGERWYLPKIGRWTQQDPLNQALDPRQANRYTYAGADPANLADPTGAFSLDLNVNASVLGFGGEVGVEIDPDFSVHPYTGAGGGGTTGGGGSVGLSFGERQDGPVGGGCVLACYSAGPGGSSVGVGPNLDSSASLFCVELGGGWVVFG